MNWLRTIDGSFAGVSGSIIEEGKEQSFDNTFIDATNFERDKYSLTGDKAEVYRTELIKKYQFPEYENEYFVTEDVCYQEIAAEGYKLRWYNTPIEKKTYLPDGLTKTGSNSLDGHLQNYKGYCYWIKRGLIVKPFSDKYWLLKSYLKTAKHKKNNIRQMASDIDQPLPRFLLNILFVLPLSFLSHLIKKWR